MASEIETPIQVNIGGKPAIGILWIGRTNLKVGVRDTDRVVELVAIRVPSTETMWWTAQYPSSPTLAGAAAEFSKTYRCAAARAEFGCASIGMGALFVRVTRDQVRRDRIREFVGTQVSNLGKRFESWGFFNAFERVIVKLPELASFFYVEVHGLIPRYQVLSFEGTPKEWQWTIRKTRGESALVELNRQLRPVSGRIIQPSLTPQAE